MIELFPLLISCFLGQPSSAGRGALPDASAMSQLGPASQLTDSTRFIKAGESYISPDGTKVIFQGVPTPPAGQAQDKHYGMYLAEIVPPSEERAGWSLANIQRISPDGSSNTCGWFHPTDPRRVIFGSTITPPSEDEGSGYQRDSRDYRWTFQPEMRIVEARIDGAMPPSLRLLEGDEQAYQAECSISPDGRHLLYASAESDEECDIYIRDLETGDQHRIVSAAGYDGGPFFSPDGRRICYRSDRNQDKNLQLFVGELAFNDAGTITGLEREFQLTDNTHVNWAPFWHSDGRHLVYTTSEKGHGNYEVFIIDADAGDPGSARPARYGTRKARVTFADRFDGLPAFDAGSDVMIWTSQRDDNSSQLWIAPFPNDPETLLDPASPPGSTNAHD